MNVTDDGAGDVCYAVFTATVNATVIPAAMLPLIVPSSWTARSSPKTMSVAKLT